MGIFSRIKRIHVIAAGGVVFVGLLLAFTLSFLQPTLQEIKELERRRQEQEQKWQGLPAAIAGLHQAQQTLAQSKADAERFLATRGLPQLKAKDDFDAMFVMHRVYTNDIGPPLYRYFMDNAQYFSIGGLSIPATPMRPLKIPAMINFNWRLTIQDKSMQGIFDALAQLKYMPFPGVIGGIRSISGTSPHLSVSTPLSVYIITPGALEKPAALAPPPGVPAPAVPSRPAPEGVSPDMMQELQKKLQRDRGD